MAASPCANILTLRDKVGVAPQTVRGWQICSANLAMHVLTLTVAHPKCNQNKLCLTGAHPRQRRTYCRHVLPNPIFILGPQYRKFPCSTQASYALELRQFLFEVPALKNPQSIGTEFSVSVSEALFFSSSSGCILTALVNVYMLTTAGSSRSCRTNAHPSI